jgi:hypothetical protein
MGQLYGCSMCVPVSGSTVTFISHQFLAILRWVDFSTLAWQIIPVCNCFGPHVIGCLFCYLCKSSALLSFTAKVTKWKASCGSEWHLLVHAEGKFTSSKQSCALVCLWILAGPWKLYNHISGMAYSGQITNSWCQDQFRLIHLCLFPFVECDFAIHTR